MEKYPKKVLRVAMQCEILILVAALVVDSSSSRFMSTGKEDKCEENAPVVRNFSNTDSFARIHEDIDLYCTFEFHDNLTASTAVPKWTSQDGLTRHATTNITISDTLVTVILSLNNVTETDEDLYRISVGYLESCSKRCNYSISLTVMPECFGMVPEPMNDSNVTIVSPVDVPYLNLTAVFTGDDNVHNIIWSYESVYVLQERDKYTISHKDIPPCTIVKELIIHNLSMSDAGIYSARVQDSHNIKYFNVIVFESKQNPKKSILLEIIVPAVAFICASICVCICVVCICCRKKKRDYDRLSIRNGSNLQICMVTTNPGKQLTRNDLVHIAKKITHWKVLARRLRLSEPDITAIESNDPHNYKEQTFKMLLEWLQQQDCPPTQKDFLQIIAEMDVVLAGNINSVFEE